MFLVVLKIMLTESGKRVKNERRFGEINMHLELQEPPLYTFNMLSNATNNFQESNKLGEGGFGPVYKVVESDHMGIICNRVDN